MFVHWKCLHVTKSLIYIKSIFDFCLLLTFQKHSQRSECSICSYQCDNWYVSNWRLACHINLCWGYQWFIGFWNLFLRLQVDSKHWKLGGGLVGSSHFWGSNRPRQKLRFFKEPTKVEHFQLLFTSLKYIKLNSILASIPSIFHVFTLPEPSTSQLKRYHPS